MTTEDKRRIKRRIELIRLYEDRGTTCEDDALFIAEEKRKLRKLIKESCEEPKVKVFINKDAPEYWSELREVEYDGTKEELVKELWENAHVVTSPYDCSGQTFTRWFTVAHVSGNRFKVLEALAVDV